MNNKDWTGNKKTTFVSMGASNHSEKEREVNDFYATSPTCATDLLNVLPELDNIWECACGQGHLARVFDEAGKLGKASDLIDRGYGEVQDFLLFSGRWDGDIITNPPYKYAEAFWIKALEIIPEGRYYCAFLKLTFLEGKARNKIYKKFPPKYVYVYSSRQICAMNGDFHKYKATAIAYSWYVWQKGFNGEPTIRWIG
jgi:hypothetical protein